MSMRPPFSPRRFGVVADGSTRIPVVANPVGGVEIGDAGETGTMYEGYTLSWGDEFDTLDIVGPAAPRGKWFTTRTYGSGPRGSDTLLGTMFDADPLFTGHNDSNRGVPVGYDNMTVASSELVMTARKATVGEQTHMSSTRNELAAMISGTGVIHWYPDAASTGDIIYEARMKLSAAAGNPAGWHPTLWLASINQGSPTNLDELDWEANSAAAQFNRNIQTDGVASGSTVGSPYANDGAYHVIGMVINTTNVKLYIDGSLYATGSWNGNSKGKPQSALLTNHVYNGTYAGEAYSAAAWNADPDGATFSVDWIRVWRRTGKGHFAPLTSISDQNVDYGSSLTITLPSALTLWGDASVTEYVAVIQAEENEPGGDHAARAHQFPTGVSYNSGTRELTINITSGKTGRLNFGVHAWKTDGTTGEPLRFAVNVGPRWTTTSIDFATGSSVSYDLYAIADCGVLTTNGTAKTKTISVSGFGASGLSYSDSTGLITGTAVAGSYTLSATVTNSVGQSKTQSISMSVATEAAYASWTGPGWFDASDAASVNTSGATVTTVANQRSGGDALNGGSDVTYATAAQNGLNAFRFARNTSNPARLVAASNSSSALSTMFQGSDKAFTVICVFKPTDTNTGYIWGASDTVDATDNQMMSLLRRNATASSVRKQSTTANSVDSTFGSGHASGTAKVIAVKHSGTAVTVWENSTTKTLNASAQDLPTLNTELIFRIGAVESNNAVDPTFVTTICAMDFFELIMEDSAKSDADIEQAITDLATKWGITLS